MGDILFLAHRAPFPPDRGDRIRAFHILRHLTARARVHLVAFADDAAEAETARARASDLASIIIVPRRKSKVMAGIQSVFTGRPASVEAFADSRLSNAVKTVLTRETIDTLYVYSGQMAQYLPSDHRAQVVMDFVDMDSQKFAAYAESASGPSAWVNRREAHLLQAFEQDVAGRADASLFVSEAEAALFRRLTGASRIIAVENGIDTDFYDPATVTPVGEAGPLLVFTGQMDYRPNVEGCLWFADAILPKIRSRHPQARFAIVGRNPDAAIRALAARPEVIVTGEVPDVRTWLAAASVAVAPLKLARGIQNKVLEAMAMARPVVASAAAAEGIDHAETILVGRDEADFAAAVNELLTNADRSMALGQAARARVVSRYGWAARLAALDALLGSHPELQRAAE
ncbi:TIGR03087 family PEP-CTERM/XrtA system glycosyltransferase [Stakelama sediminis]|uniref:Sugar transferase (PEP-CTERM/EpsH1 system associated) n=1 Tax=Stakelama sediminis TaxID=463200 RepID=A0A840YU70_9SPHN|nr:TIGR03087 family PEP-CTERM/XrtA system glycosyltransferase [Stakelama sediminis]MBB5717178.1 sugar transferase (PEP-CTERM/EpsH1 system associated) [Stakelama sediminis]